MTNCVKVILGVIKKNRGSMFVKKISMLKLSSNFIDFWLYAIHFC